MFFYCSLSCAAKKANAERPTARVPVEKICPHCGETFETLTGAKSSTFCSRSCASAGSVTDKRRNLAGAAGKLNLLHDVATIASSLRSREWWKYKQLAFVLDRLEEAYEFEHVVGNNIHDLALLDKRVIVEFDGISHESGQQKEADVLRDKEAQDAGWEVHRICVPPNQVIQPSVLSDIVQCVRK